MTELTLAQLTEKKLDGGGVFDVILQTLKLHLDTQFNADRITGPEYATVYLGQVEAAMQTGLSFLTQRQRIGLEAELLAKQVELAEKQIQIAAATLLQTQAQTELVRQQTENAKIEAEVLTAQKCKLQAEYDYTVQNTLKAAAEITLIVQKTATEKAQVLGVGVDDNSVIGKQKGLYQAQTDGFKRDAEQKAAKLYVDVWSAQRMTDPDVTSATEANGLAPGQMASVMSALRNGIGA